MKASSTLSRLMAAPSLPTHWNLSYGITDNRASSLMKGPNHANSFFNPNSETSLTLFIFTLIDGWKQLDSLTVKPRKEDSTWNEEFFGRVKDGGNIYHSEPEGGRWSDMPMDELRDTEDTVLLFEFQVTNRAFHSGKKGAAENLSFLDTEGQRWCQFDAVLIVPEKKIFIFFEAKLDSDIHHRTEKFEGVDQMIRGLETAFLLTNHEESPYRDWDFQYYMVCPRLLSQYDLTNYNRELESIQNKLVKYNNLLNRRFKSRVNEDTYPMYFGGFVKKVPERVNCLHWDELADTISWDHSFFHGYLKDLEDILGPDQIDKIEKRFKKAGIGT